MFVVVYYMQLCFPVLIFPAVVSPALGHIWTGVSVLVEECGIYGFHLLCQIPFGIFAPCRLITGSRAWYSSVTPKIVNATDPPDSCVLPFDFLVGYNCVLWPFRWRRYIDWRWTCCALSERNAGCVAVVQYVSCCPGFLTILELGRWSTPRSSIPFRQVFLPAYWLMVILLHPL